MVDTRPATLNRKLLGEFLKSPETIMAFENLSLNSEDLADIVTAIQNVSVLTVGLSDTFENERVVASDGEVQLTDGGPGGNLTFGLADTGVTAGSYGDASHTVQIAINAKGRVTLAQAHPLNTDNVAEGSTNLYFTNARARNALSGGTGISYSSVTGQIAVSAKLALYDGGDTPSAFTLSIMDSADASAWLSALGAVPASRSISTGAGLIGGGNLTADRTLSLATSGVTAGSYGSATKVPTITVDVYGRVTIASENTIPTLASGIYTPTLTNVANIDASTAFSCQYMRVGDTVTVSGRANVDPTATGSVLLGISLPIASNFANLNECAGAAFCPSLSGVGAAILADATNDRAQMEWIATNTANQALFFNFSYRVI